MVVVVELKDLNNSDKAIIEDKKFNKGQDQFLNRPNKHLQMITPKKQFSESQDSISTSSTKKYMYLLNFFISNKIYFNITIIKI